MKTILLTLLLAFGLTANATTPEAQSASGASVVHAESLTSLHSEWQMSHSYVQIDEKYEWVLAIAMAGILFFALEEHEHKKKKKKHRR